MEIIEAAIPALVVLIPSFFVWKLPVRQHDLGGVAEIDEIPEAIAARELDGNIKKLSATGEMKLEWMERALDMARLIGMKDLAPAKDIFVTQFKPVPTTA